MQQRERACLRPNVPVDNLIARHSRPPGPGSSLPILAGPGEEEEEPGKAQGEHAVVGGRLHGARRRRGDTCGTSWEASEPANKRAVSLDEPWGR
jgi:hypothetical protein